MSGDRIGDRSLSSFSTHFAGKFVAEKDENPHRVQSPAKRMFSRNISTSEYTGKSKVLQFILGMEIYGDTGKRQNFKLLYCVNQNTAVNDFTIDLSKLFNELEALLPDILRSPSLLRLHAIETKDHDFIAATERLPQDALDEQVFNALPWTYKPCWTTALRIINDFVVSSFNNENSVQVLGKEDLIEINPCPGWFAGSNIPRAPEGIRYGGRLEHDIMNSTVLLSLFIPWERFQRRSDSLHALSLWEELSQGLSPRFQQVIKSAALLHPSNW
ncbi:hypothetical protein QBC38DRAFT_451398 [Podospora fimiseda]|uniref:Uncharacterized protein n=1 Tax=Podospora fimiseda TaxID=252190 RepID=A0AAN7BYP7_9PEZI|nr:hypothetical protein QBC38DRAFT_451398 [Podospora fimiseda]